MGDQRFVYIIQGQGDPARFYSGLTSDVHSRLDAHNAGRSLHTATHRPWRIRVAIEFDSEEKARAFEKYLKSGSGAAFAARHFR